MCCFVPWCVVFHDTLGLFAQEMCLIVDTPTEKSMWTKVSKSKHPYTYILIILTSPPTKRHISHRHNHTNAHTNQKVYNHQHEIKQRWFYIILKYCANKFNDKYRNAYVCVCVCDVRSPVQYIICVWCVCVRVYVCVCVRARVLYSPDEIRISMSGNFACAARKRE